MKIRLILILISTFSVAITFGQDRAKYSKLVTEADNLYQLEEFRMSADKYKEAFDALDGKAYPVDRYNAACSYSLAGSYDTAFIHLFSLAKYTGYTNIDRISTDPDLAPLHTDPRWQELLAIIRANKAALEKNYDRDMVAVLNQVLVDDQQYRTQLEKVEKQYGRNSDEYKALVDKINEMDSVNLVKVKKILDERGWLGKDVVGERGNIALFLVIQHADLETQIRYLPMMKEAVIKGDARPETFALLSDRVAIRQDKRQIYGSQIGRNEETGEYYVFPIEDPDNVDKRRAEVGLVPMATYVSQWSIVWNVEKHKAQSAKIEAEKK